MVEYKNLKAAVVTLRRIQSSQRGGALSALHEQRLMEQATVLLALPRLSGSLARDSRFVICLRADGDSNEVHSHMAGACVIATAEGGRVLDDEVPEWWEGRHALFPEFVLSKRPRIMLVAITPMGRYEEACDLALKFGEEHDMNITLLGYPFGGPIMLAHFIIRVDGTTPKSRVHTLVLARKLMDELMTLGCVPHRVGTDFLPVLIKRLDPAYYGLVKRIKKLLDPNGIMKPGVVVPRP